MQIDIPNDLVQKIEIQAKKSGEFSTAQDYIIFVLEQLVTDQPAYSASDEAKVKERLEGLGYLD